MELRVFDKSTKFRLENVTRRRRRIVVLFFAFARCCVLFSGGKCTGARKGAQNRERARKVPSLNPIRGLQPGQLAVLENAYLLQRFPSQVLFPWCRSRG